MKKSDILNLFTKWMSWKEKDLDKEKSVFGSDYMEEIKAEYRLNLKEAKEELFKSSSPLELYQELEHYFNEFVSDLMMAVDDDPRVEIPHGTFIDDFIQLFIGEALKDMKWEDES